MKRIITKWIVAMLLIVTAVNFSKAALVSDAGTASATEDSICVDGSTALILTGYTGAIQWQSFDGTNWIDETNPGATTDNYSVTLTVTTDFRAVVTDVGFPSDTSNVVTITVGVTAPTTTGDTRCGYGPVTLTASGGGATFKWYDVPTGGIPLYTGPSFTTNVASTTTFYAASASNGGGSATAPLPPELNPYAFNTRGYWFTAPVDFTIIGLYVPEPVNGATQNIAVLKFNGGTPPQPYPAVTNAFSTLFITQNDATPGVIAVSIPVFAGDVIGVLATRGLNTNSYAAPGTYLSSIDGQNVTFTRMGMQFELSSILPMDIWEEPGGNIARCEITYEVGCESARTTAIATVTAADPITVTANPPALCAGQSSVMSVSSNNANYTYTWSPATGLSGTTGSSVTATPLTPTTYTIVADDGTCGAIDSVFMDVGPASAAGTASISSDTICLGGSAYLTLNGYTGNIQWQSFDGTNWINETGIGSTSPSYEVSPTTNIIYQAVVTSGGCDPDTTITLNLDVLTIVDPTTVNDTTCAPGGVVDLTASGAGVLNWFTSATGGASINMGTTYSPNISATTTYYVEASAGGHFVVGPPTLGFGSQYPLAGNDYGLQFDVIQQATIEKVWVSPGIVSGNITINLKDLGGAVLNQVSAPVTSFSGLVPISLGFLVSPGTYSLSLAAGNVELYYNSTNAIYPYTSPGCPVTITGYLNPAFGTGPQYYFFYNWEINQGCVSNRVPVIGVVNPAPAVPTIIQNGTILTSSSPSNNQWYLNGSPIAGATGITYDMSLTGPGTYTVSVTVDGCSSTSAPVIFVGLNEAMAAAGISVYPNPVRDVLSVEFDNPLANGTVISIYNAVGEMMWRKEVQDVKSEVNFNFPAGIYSVEIKTAEGLYVTKVIKL